MPAMRQRSAATGLFCATRAADWGVLHSGLERSMLRTGGALPHQMQRTAPAGLVEEMDDNAGDELRPLRDLSLGVLVARRKERPIDEQRPADDILARNKA